MFALTVQPRDDRGACGPSLVARPGRAGLIKEEPKTLVWRQPLPDGTRAVWKLYRHRRIALPERLGLYRNRALREYAALRHLDRHGIPCSRPAFWAEGRDPTEGAYALLVTHEIAGACDFHSWINAARGTQSPLMQPLFRLVADMHRSGLQHGTLLERNVLLSPSGFHLIDFPRSHLYPQSIEGRPAGWFDLHLFIQSLKRHFDDGVLANGLAGYARLPCPAAEFVRRARAHPWSKRRRKAIEFYYAAHAFFHGLTAAPGGAP